MFAASSLQTSVAVGVTLGVMLHCVQLAWVALGVLIPGVMAVAIRGARPDAIASERTAV